MFWVLGWAVYVGFRRTQNHFPISDLVASSIEEAGPQLRRHLWKNIHECGFFLWVVVICLWSTRVGSGGRGNLIMFRWDFRGRKGRGGLLEPAQIRLESSCNLGTCREPSGRVSVRDVAFEPDTWPHQTSLQSQSQNRSSHTKCIFASPLNFSAFPSPRHPNRVDE